MSLGVGIEPFVNKVENIDSKKGIQKLVAKVKKKAPKIEAKYKSTISSIENKMLAADMFLYGSFGGAFLENEWLRWPAIGAGVIGYVRYHYDSLDDITKANKIYKKFIELYTQLPAAYRQ